MGWQYQGLNVTGAGGMPYAFDGLFLVEGKKTPVEVVQVNALNQEKKDRLFSNIYAFKEEVGGEYRDLVIVLLKGHRDDVVPNSIKSLIAGAEYPIKLFEVAYSDLKPTMVLQWGNCLQALRHLRLSARPHRRRVPRARRHGRYRPPSTPPWRARSEQARAASQVRHEGLNLDYSGPATAVPRLRHARAPKPPSSPSIK
jgi:hypothetical protein